MNKYYVSFIIFIIFPLITAQVPFEYFELSSLKPPKSIGDEFIEPPTMPPHLYLDSQTQAAGDLTLSEPFAPPAGNHIRRRVYSQIEIKHDANLIYIVPDRSPCKPWHMENVSSKYTLHRSALVYRENNGTNTMDIPGDSPEMIITSFKGYCTDNPSADDVTLLKCPDDVYTVSSASRGKYKFEYETVSLPDASQPKPAEFFLGKKCTPAQRENPEVESFLSELVNVEPTLKKISHKKDPLYDLVRHFQSFKSVSLTGENTNNGVNKAFILQMLREKKGLCRHRAIMMVLASRAMGCSARIAANEIHAFVELNIDGRWYPIELGGEARSLTIQPTNTRLSAKTTANYSFLENAHSPAENIQAHVPAADGNVKINPNPSPSRNHESTINKPHFSEVKFVPDMPLSSITRDVDIFIQGTFLDTNGVPLDNRDIFLVLSRADRRMNLRLKSDSKGYGQIKFRLPADWPLGTTDAVWQVLDLNE